MGLRRRPEPEETSPHLMPESSRADWIAMVMAWGGNQRILPAAGNRQETSHAGTQRKMLPPGTGRWSSGPVANAVTGRNRTYLQWRPQRASQ